MKMFASHVTKLHVYLKDGLITCVTITVYFPTYTLCVVLTRGSANKMCGGGVLIAVLH